jgi:hypothetical protein
LGIGAVAARVVRASSAAGCSAQKSRSAWLTDVLVLCQLTVLTLTLMTKFVSGMMCNLLTF